MASFPIRRRLQEGVLLRQQPCKEHLGASDLRVGPRTHAQASGPQGAAHAAGHGGPAGTHRKTAVETLPPDCQKTSASRHTRSADHPHSLNPHTWHFTHPSANSSCEPQSGHVPMNTSPPDLPNSTCCCSPPDIGGRVIGTPAAGVGIGGVSELTGTSGRRSTRQQVLLHALLVPPPLLERDTHRVGHRQHLVRARGPPRDPTRCRAAGGGFPAARCPSAARARSSRPIASASAMALNRPPCRG